jgi:hypothetical protein
MRTLVITTDNPNYDGKTFGVQFSNGQAVVSEAVPNKLGHSLDTLAHKFQHEMIGYQAEFVEDEKPQATGKKVKE